jgi:hypothetical protein
VKFSKLNNPEKIVNISISKYLVDWDRKVSKPQLATKSFLRQYWETSTILEEFVIPGSKLRADLINLTSKIFLEVSPNSTHKKFNPFMHGSRIGFLGTIKRDEQKRVWAEQNGFQYVELTDLHLNNLTKETFAELGIDL